MNTPHKKLDEQERSSAKKPYSPPQLQLYGDIRRITQKDQKNGNPDNLGASHKNTHA